MRSIVSVVLAASCCWWAAGCGSGGSPVTGIDLLGDGLAGWECFLEKPGVPMSAVWQVEDGVLSCRGAPRGYLYTKKHYGDFTLALEWRWPAGTKPGKGGVLVRMRGDHRIWPTSLEAQLNAGDAGDFWGLAGFALSGPPGRMKTLQHRALGRLINVKKTGGSENEPGRWNTYEVVARGGTVTIRLNGEEVNRAAGCETTAGPICLTAEGSPIAFRNIRITE